MDAANIRKDRSRFELALLALLFPVVPMAAAQPATPMDTSPPPPVAGLNDPVGTAFDRMKALRGEWVEEGARGHVRLVYETIADGTVLIEHWDAGRDRRTMTVYFRDGAQLMATHYCFQGNQPRLVLTEILPNGRLSFTYKDATNLPSLAISHLAALWFEMSAHDRLVRGETYQSAMGPDVGVMRFRRVR